MNAGRTQGTSYYRRALVLFAHVSRTSDANLPGWADGWRHVDPRPHSMSPPSRRTCVAFTWKMSLRRKSPSIVGIPLVRVLCHHAPHVALRLMRIGRRLSASFTPTCLIRRHLAPLHRAHDANLLVGVFVAQDLFGGL